MSTCKPLMFNVQVFIDCTFTVKQLMFLHNKFWTSERHQMDTSVTVKDLHTNTYHSQSCNPYLQDYITAQDKSN
jgi:hypothetical protein